MIYISSASVRREKISECVEILARAGYRNIELSGGSKYYVRYADDLQDLKHKYDLYYLIHNYFPPPQIDFVLNLASLDDQIFKQTSEHMQRAINLCKKLGADRYSFHAGFFVNLLPQEVGERISTKKIISYEKSLQRFCEGFEDLTTKAGDIMLYIENNVISADNLLSFKGKNPFMLTDYRGYLQLSKKINFKLLLDIAHLKVSSQTLNLNFDEQLAKLIAVSDYLHLSENNGSEDQNRNLSKNSDLLVKLRKFDFTGKIITLEIYEDLDNIGNSYQMVSEITGLS